MPLALPRPQSDFIFKRPWDAALMSVLRSGLWSPTSIVVHSRSSIGKRRNGRRWHRALSLRRAVHLKSRWGFSEIPWYLRPTVFHVHADGHKSAFQHSSPGWSEGFKPLSVGTHVRSAWSCVHDGLRQAYGHIIQSRRSGLTSTSRTCADPILSASSAVPRLSHAIGNLPTEGTGNGAIRIEPASLEARDHRRPIPSVG